MLALSPRQRKLWSQIAIIIALAVAGLWIYSNSTSNMGASRGLEADSKSTHPGPTVDLSTWGLSLSAESLTLSLPSWPSKDPIDESLTPLSPLGHKADQAYNLGPIDLPSYAAALDTFAESSFPFDIAQRLKLGLATYVADVPGLQKQPWAAGHKIWQLHEGGGRQGHGTRAGKGWDLAQGWTSKSMTDDEIEAYVAELFEGTRVEAVWKILPSSILRRDMFRYLVLLVEGGIYTSTNSHLLQPLEFLGQGAQLWQSGRGWLSNAQRVRIRAGVRWEDVLGHPSVVVGVGVDVGDEQNWRDLSSRPIQVVSWTMASAPSHPIVLSCILRILHATADAITWSHSHASIIKHLTSLNRLDDAQAVRDVDVLFEPKDGGPIGVSDWTGEGVWTDAVIAYLRVKYGMEWTDLRGLVEPLRVGDVVILPVTGFSSGEGDAPPSLKQDLQAMVYKDFSSDK